LITVKTDLLFIDLLEDGAEQDHKTVGSKDPKALDNLVR
jgi:hypothetical protein